MLAIQQAKNHATNTAEDSVSPMRPGVGTRHGKGPTKPTPAAAIRLDSS